MTDRRGNANKQVTLLVASLSSFLTSFIIAAINLALPSIGTDLSMAAVLLGWFTTSYLLATAMSLVPFGKVADLVGRKGVFMFGVVLVWSSRHSRWSWRLSRRLPAGSRIGSSRGWLPQWVWH